MGRGNRSKTLNMAKVKPQRPPIEAQTGKSPLNYDLVDFRYLVNVEYRNVQNCNDSCRTDMCRCSVIEDAHVDDIYGSSIHFAAQLSRGWRNKSKPPTEMERYAMWRVAQRHMPDITVDNFDISITGGYYGEEIDDVRLTGQVAAQIDTDLHAFSKCRSRRQQVEWLLNYEYGRVLGVLENRRWTVEDIPVADILAPSTHADPDVVAQYRKDIKDRFAAKDMPMGVLRKTSTGEYRLIDGYHRFAANQAAGNKTVKMIVAN